MTESDEFLSWRREVLKVSVLVARLLEHQEVCATLCNAPLWKLRQILLKYLLSRDLLTNLTQQRESVFYFFISLLISHVKKYFRINLCWRNRCKSFMNIKNEFLTIETINRTFIFRASQSRWWWWRCSCRWKRHHSQIFMKSDSFLVHAKNARKWRKRGDSWKYCWEKRAGT